MKVGDLIMLATNLQPFWMGIAVSVLCPLINMVVRYMQNPFAFQVIGFLTWQKEGDYRSVLPMYRQYLSEYVYDKVWSEMSNKDKKICNGIANTESGKIKDVRERLSLKTNEFNRKIECLKEIGEGVLSDFI